MTGFVTDDVDDRIRILHVDDDLEFADLAADFLEREDDRFTVEPATSASEGVTMLSDTDYDCIVSDFDMPGQDGIEFLEAVRKEYPDLPFILYTGMGSEEVASEAISVGVTDYLQKGSGADQYTILANRIKNAVAQTRAEREVTRTREYFGTILEHASDFVMVVDENARVDYISPAVERVLGYTPDELKGVDAFERIHPEDLPVASEAFADVLEQPNQVHDIEYRARHTDGTWVWLEVRGRNRLDDPVIDGIIVSARDITDRKGREQQLHRERDRFRAVFEEAFDAMVLADNNGQYIEVNESAAELFGLPADELVGRSIEEFAPEDFDFEAVWREFQQSDNERGTFPLVRLDGEERIVEYAATRDVIPGQHLSVLRDVTEREQRERRLHRQNERLDEFTSIVSHDLRNPLTAAAGGLTLAREEGDNEHFERVEGALDRMDALIEDLLALAREGEDVAALEPVDLPAIAEGCWKNVETADATLVTDIDRTIYAADSRLKQLFENLIHNAVEHGGGDVTVTIGKLDDGFYIEDDGHGIPPDERDEIFRAGYSTSDDGTGFGLSIVKQVVEAHDWQIEVTEGSGGGARFEFRGVEPG